MLSDSHTDGVESSSDCGNASGAMLSDTDPISAVRIVANRSMVMAFRGSRVFRLARYEVQVIRINAVSHLRSAMSSAVATAAVTTAEASHVSAPAKAARMATAKRLVMPSAIVMVLPGMVVDENR